MSKVLGLIENQTIDYMAGIESQALGFMSWFQAQYL